MEEHRLKNLLDLVRAPPELGKGMRSTSRTISVARSRPTLSGSSEATCAWTRCSIIAALDSIKKPGR
jgi:hypothetical protein